MDLIQCKVVWNILQNCMVKRSEIRGFRTWKHKGEFITSTNLPLFLKHFVTFNPSGHEISTSLWSAYGLSSYPYSFFYSMEVSNIDLIDINLPLLREKKKKNAYPQTHAIGRASVVMSEPEPYFNLVPLVKITHLTCQPSLVALQYNTYTHIHWNEEKSSSRGGLTRAEILWL